MKGIILNEAGGVENLQYVDLPKPNINENEVLVQVHSLSVNPVDFKTRTNNAMLSRFFGVEKPYILGWDISGIVVEIGKNVTNFKLHDSVFGMVNFPDNGRAYAEYVAAPTTHLALKPSTISHHEAAAATLAALTAWQTLVTHGNVKKGDKVFIHGASGGVGHYAVQIAKYLGAYVIGSSSAKNKAFVLQNGADIHIDYTTQDFEQEVSNVDFVFNTVGGALTGQSVSITRNGGKIITIAGGITPEITENAQKRNIDLSSILVQSSGTDMAIIADLLEKGIIKSHIATIFPFHELYKAHQQLEMGRTVGKIIVAMDS
jgi:NADPH:quinone reductase-like Zn-dependent oxidoreductase